MTQKQGWQGKLIEAGPFTLMSYTPLTQASSTRLTVYIEGDGMAWMTSNLPSSDPTPVNPIALQLALAQPSGNVAYLGRPCQYIGAEASACAQRYWTNERFSPAVVASTQIALDRLKRQFDAQKLTLVGYSGGAAVALLSAARREDVTQVITVAGNLDHQAWTTYHRIHPLAGSLNPADAIESLKSVRQVHFAGERDRIIPPPLIQDYVVRFPSTAPVTVKLQTAFDHQCCWIESWPTLWRQVVVE